jgi:biotin carboxyl carrier protein
MKMEMVVTARVCGKIDRLLVTKGDTVHSGDLLSEIKVD